MQLNEQHAAHLYRIAQEAVSNAVKHAEASCINVRLSSVGRSLELSVEDDGEGLSKETREEGLGLGMHTMRYRADLLGGQLEIDQRREGGTVVCCRIDAPQ